MSWTVSVLMQVKSDVSASWIIGMILAKTRSVHSRCCQVPVLTTLEALAIPTDTKVPIVSRPFPGGTRWMS